MADFSNYFVTTAALFPIMVLTKTVSMGIGDGRVFGRFRYPLHVGHISLCFLGEGIALYGIWDTTKESGLATAVTVILAIAADALGAELLVAPYRHASAEQSPANMAGGASDDRG
jgi:hypothetical protein